MSQEWFYATDGQTNVSPVSTDELKRLALSGKLAPTDLVQMAGVPKWVPAAKVKGLFDAPTPVVAADPPGSQARTPTPRTPGQRAAALVGQLMEKYRSKPKVVLFGAGGLSLAVLLTCCGGLGLVGLLARKADTELTAAYYPHKPRLDRTFVRKVYSPLNADSPPIDSRWQMLHKPDGTIETIGPPPFNVTETVKYRQADGYVELGLRDGTWVPVLKLGAKPGEGWERHGRSYTFKEFTRYNGVPCAIVLEESDYQGSRRETLNWYAKGDGMVKQEERLESNGELKLVCVMTVAGAGDAQNKSKDEQPKSEKPNAEKKSEYDWKSKQPAPEKADAQKPEKGGVGGQKGGKVYSVKVEGRTVRVELSEEMAEEIALSDLVYNKHDGGIDMKLKMLKPISRKYTNWRYTLVDKNSVLLESGVLIHPAISEGQTGAVSLFLGSKNAAKVTKITLP